MRPRFERVIGYHTRQIALTLTPPPRGRHAAPEADLAALLDREARLDALGVRPTVDPPEYEPEADWEIGDE